MEMFEVKYDLPVEEFFEAADSALQEHWEVIANFKDAIKLKPDVGRYISLQSAGVLRTVSLVADSGEIIGYSVLLVMPHLHYSDDLFAHVDVVFVKKSFRKSRAGLVLLSETEKLCKELGVSVLTYHTKPNHNTIEKILYRKGYTHLENIIGKYVR